MHRHKDRHSYQCTNQSNFKKPGMHWPVAGTQLVYYYYNILGQQRNGFIRQYSPSSPAISVIRGRGYGSSTTRGRGHGISTTHARGRSSSATSARGCGTIVTETW